MAPVDQLAAMLATVKALGDEAEVAAAAVARVVAARVAAAALVDTMATFRSTRLS